MKVKNIYHLVRFFYDNPLHKWSFGKGSYVKHIQSIDRWIKKYSNKVENFLVCEIENL